MRKCNSDHVLVKVPGDVFERYEFPYEWMKHAVPLTSRTDPFTTSAYVNYARQYPTDVIVELKVVRAARIVRPVRKADSVDLPYPEVNDLCE